MHKELLMNYIYLDNAASTKPIPVVNTDFKYINEEFYANPSASHIMGIEAEKLVDRSRMVISSFLGKDPDNIIFTSGGTESINMALRGAYKAYGNKRKTIITTKTEHAASYETLLDLTKEGANILYIDINKDNTLDLKSLSNLLSSDILMVTIIHVNNETGIINPLGEIARIIKAYDPGILFHADIVQSFGKFDLKNDLKQVDMYSCSAHKIHGPKGIGILGIKRDVRLSPIITGGGQEYKRRAGTIDLPLIYSFAGVISEIKNSYLDDYTYVTGIKNYLMDQIINSDLEYSFNFADNDTSPYILNVSFPGVRSEILMHFLEESNIIISAGAACSSRSKGNRILEGYGLSRNMTGSAVRISFSKFSAKEEMDLLVQALCRVIPKIKHVKR
jgi:cysteine desulfurase